MAKAGETQGATTAKAGQAQGRPAEDPKLSEYEMAQIATRAFVSVSSVRRWWKKDPTMRKATRARIHEAAVLCGVKVPNDRRPV